jgi:hypothetical protein
MYVKCNIEARSCNNICSGKAISIAYYGCVFVALCISKLNAHVPYYHLWSARHYIIFSTLSHKRYDFRKGKKC